MEFPYNRRLYKIFCINGNTGFKLEFLLSPIKNATTLIISFLVYA